MRPEEWRQYSDEELLERRKSLYMELFNFRNQLATGQLENLKKIKEIKKDIARIYTLLKERQLQNEKRKKG